jgi:hypothetical protein
VITITYEFKQFNRMQLVITIFGTTYLIGVRKIKTRVIMIYIDAIVPSFLLQNPVSSNQSITEEQIRKLRILLAIIIYHLHRLG